MASAHKLRAALDSRSRACATVVDDANDPLSLAAAQMARFRSYQKVAADCDRPAADVITKNLATQIAQAGDELERLIETRIQALQEEASRR